MAHSTPDFFSKHHIARNKSLSDGSYPYSGGMHSPKKQTIRNILAYSKALEVKPSKAVDHVSVVLN